MSGKGENKFVAALNKIAVVVNTNKYISSIKDAFYSLIPIIITGAFATLFSSMVFDDTTGLAQIKALHWLVNLKPIAAGINYATLSFFTIYAVFLIGIEMGKKIGITGNFPGIIALMSYVSVNPTVYNFVSGKKNIQVTDVFAKQYTDTTGLFLGMIVALLSVRLYGWLKERKALNINMPDTVPSNVSRSFSALFPTMLTVAIIATFSFVFTALTKMTLYQVIYNVVQQPLQNAVQGLPGILLLMLISQIFWIIGIHGNQMIKPIREPLLIAAITANTEAQAAGKPLPNIITMPFWDMYMSMGGSGVTIGLLIAIFLVCKKRADMKAIAKLSLVPGLFNINEPMIFGMPIVLNPILAIPFIITPLITGTIGYIATATGFAARAYVYTPWPTPPLISGFLATGGNWGAVITQVVCIAVSVLIYLPFVKILDNQAPTSESEN